MFSTLNTVVIFRKVLIRASYIFSKREKAHHTSERNRERSECCPYHSSAQLHYSIYGSRPLSLNFFYNAEHHLNESEFQYYTIVPT